MRKALPLLLALICLPLAVSAQGFTGTSGTVDPLAIDITPQYPRPYDTIEIAPSSNVIDLAASTVSVSVNGNRLYDGSGSAPTAVTLGGAGSAADITMTVSWNGNTYSKTVTVRPTEVDIVPEAASTVPLMYPGAALPAPEGAMRLVAMADLRGANGKQVPPSSLSYTWKQDARTLEGQSGIGQDVLSIAAPNLYREDAYSVTAATADGSLVAEDSFTVAPATPKVLVYVQDPLLGTLFDSLVSGAFTLPGAEETFVAVPYFFSTTPAFAWTVNGTASEMSPSITVRATGTGQGSASLSVSANGASAFEQSASAFTVNFNSSQGSSNSFFGL
ncbi:MAG: hypothetical protein KGI41_03310 [Patescibacteria group bacterium]|nr:hypothetical protein [Patescibacteria group bacterium]